jgi:arginyl-tRNA synthetase
VLAELVANAVRDALGPGIEPVQVVRTLVTALGESSAVLRRGPAPLLALLEEIAGLVNRFVEDSLAVPRVDEPDDRHRTRLALVAANRRVLANGLAALGLPAPDRI